MVIVILTLVEESSRLMVLPLEIVYHCLPVLREIIAVLLNIAATYFSSNADYIAFYLQPANRLKVIECQFIIISSQAKFR